MGDGTGGAGGGVCVCVAGHGSELCLFGTQSAVLSYTLAPVTPFGSSNFSLYITFLVKC